MADRPIPTYFSHSYRPQDRGLNETFWGMFEQQGFFFSVDPPSSLGVHTHLERMMIDSSCYVGVVNFRIEEEEQYSPFVRFEYGLSLQAQLPRLLLLDSRIAQRKPFDTIPDPERFIFSVELPEEDLNELRNKITALKDRVVRAPQAPERRQRGPIGLVVSAQQGTRARAYRGNKDKLEEAVRRAGFDCKELRIPFENNSEFALCLAACEAVVLDVRGDGIPAWAFAYIYGRLVPSVKLVHLATKELASNVELPPVVEGLRMDKHEPGVESLVYWRDQDDLILQINKALQKLQRGPVRLRKEGQGEIYFKSIGRRPARVFISNSGDVSQTAGELSSLLDISNVRVVGNVSAFQYQRKNQIEVGADFWKVIAAELEVCEIFVALMGQGYQKSKWCMKELEIASKRARRKEVSILPYYVEGVDRNFLERMLGGRKAGELPKAGAAREVFNQLSRDLTLHDNKSNWHAEQPLPLGASVEAIIDALRHLAPTQLATLCNKLRAKEVEIEIKAVKRKRQARSLAEKVFDDLEQHPTPRALADKGLSPLSYMVQMLATMVDDDRRRRVLKGVLERMRRSFRAYPGEEL